MKYFLLVFFLMFSSCTKEQTTVSSRTPQFRFGEAVYVSDGFYKGCKGRVTDFHTFPDLFKYDVSVECNSVDGKFTDHFSLNIGEQYLVEDDSN